MVSFEPRQVERGDLPSFGVVVELNLLDGNGLSEFGGNVADGEFLGILQQKSMDQVVREVADAVLTDTIPDETEFLQMTTLRYLLTPEVPEQGAEILMKCSGENPAKPPSLVPCLRET